MYSVVHTASLIQATRPLNFFLWTKRSPYKYDYYYMNRVSEVCHTCSTCIESCQTDILEPWPPYMTDKMCETLLYQPSPTDGMD